MAIVYRANQPSLGRLVAIKELRAELNQDPSVVARFEREARSLAGLAHQNIVHVYDYIERAGSMFIVMEYVDGLDLYQLMNRVERLPPDIAAIIALYAARALEYAHFHGVVHRDFKPSNLMITRQGDVKLMDFGIARDEALGDLTRPGIALGTPSYMSPEQIMGERVDYRSDIFSFGIVLYQMLTGQKPFVEDGSMSVMQRILKEPFVRPRRLFPDIPSHLQRIVNRCLQKRPERRYRDTESLRRDLENYLASRVRINFSGRLLIYLRNRDLISDREASTYVRPDDAAFARVRATDLGSIDPIRALWLPIARQASMASAGFLLVFGAVFGFGVGESVGYVRIHAQPWALVRVDGGPVKTTPFVEPFALTPGRHQVSFEHPVFGQVDRTVDVVAGREQWLHVDLTGTEP